MKTHLPQSIAYSFCVPQDRVTRGDNWWVADIGIKRATEEARKLITYVQQGELVDDDVLGGATLQYDVQTPNEYLATLDDDKMLSYRDENGPVLALNAQKNYVSLYAGDARKIDPDGSLLSGLNVGKGCVRFTKSKEIAKTGIGEFIQRTIDMAKRGEDVYC